MRRGISRDPAIIRELLGAAEVLHLCFTDEEGLYSVPVNFALEGGTLYIHSGRKGRKAAALGAGVTVAFSAVAALEPRAGSAACKFSYSFKSVSGTGAARVVQDDKERARGMAAINLKHGAGGLEMDPKIFAKTVIFAIAIEEATARIHD